MAGLVVWTPSGWQWLWVPVLAILVYEVIRSLVGAWWRRRQEARVDAFLRSHRIPSDPFRHTHRVVVKEQALSDAGLVEAMVERSRAEGIPLADVQHKVRGWLDEIVPQFNLLSYYRVGYRLARLVSYALYNVRLDRASLDAAMAKVPPNSAIVLVSNHRSNMDFVVTGFMLSKSVQVSYAVGEWARVWPLESLFKSFGSYFVRRGEKDPLYHRTLEAYVQLTLKHGGIQAMFPEGGLSRDGALRPVKLGLLDMMARAKLDASFTRPLVFLPVGINFDRVLEDEVLVRETVAADHPLRRRTPAQKAKRLASLVGRTFIGGPVNLARLAAKRLKKHGVCAIHFGTPIVFDEWYSKQRPFLAEPDRHGRWQRLDPFGQAVMEQIHRTVPATPVTATAAAMARLGPEALGVGVTKGELVHALRTVLTECRQADRPLAVDNPYRATEGGRDLDGVDSELEESEEAERVLDLAMDVMKRRGLLRIEAGKYSCHAIRWDLVMYYAKSIGELP